MSERLIRIDELALGYTPDLPDQKPLLWEDGRGILFMDRTLQPMPGQVPLVSAGVPVNAVCSTGDLVFLGTKSSVLIYSLSSAELMDVTNVEDKSQGLWSFQVFGTWMLASHGGKLWIWKPKTADWNFDTFQLVKDFPSKVYIKFLLKCKNFIMAVSKDSIYWATDDDPETWTPEEDNMAGDLFIRDIQGDLEGGVALDNFIILCTQKDIVKVSYISRPYIFSYGKIYEGAGVWNQNSICGINSSVFGFGPNGLWVTDGSGITEIDRESVGASIDEELDILQTDKCMVGAWGLLNHVFFFVPKNDSLEPVKCYGFNLKNSTWTMLTWDRVCCYKQYWVNSAGILFIDDVKNANSIGSADGILPFLENPQGEIGLGWDALGLQGYGGVLWLQV